MLILVYCFSQRRGWLDEQDDDADCHWCDSEQYRAHLHGTSVWLACANPDSVGWLASTAPLCVTKDGSTRTQQQGGIVFADLPSKFVRLIDTSSPCSFSTQLADVLHYGLAPTVDRVGIGRAIDPGVAPTLHPL
jgi:hypothetical protein